MTADGEPKGRRTVRCQAVVMKQDQILLVKHVNHQTDRVYWWLPGGGIQAGESPEQAVMREVREETHLEVAVDELLFRDTDETRKHDYHTYMTFLCRPTTYEAHPGSECESSRVHSILDVAWCPLWDERTWEPGFLEPHICTLLKSLQTRLRPTSAPIAAERLPQDTAAGTLQDMGAHEVGRRSDASPAGEEATILVCARQAGDRWFGVACHDDELVATSVGASEESALGSVVRCLLSGAAHRLVEKTTPFIDATIRMLADVEDGHEESKRFRLSTRYVSDPLHAILLAAAAIPVGYVSTYGGIAAAAGTEARVAGRAMATNRLYPIVPCHRVVGSDLSLVGYGGRQDSPALLAKLGRLKAEARGYTAETALAAPAIPLYPVEWAVAKAARDGVGAPRQLALFE